MNTPMTLVIPSGRCRKCRCGSYLTTRQERTDGLCLFCADRPACSDVQPAFIAEWAMAKACREEETPEQDLLPTPPAACDLAKLLRRRFGR